MFHRSIKVTVQGPTVSASFRCADSRTDVYEFDVEEFAAFHSQLKEQAESGVFPGWDFSDSRLSLKVDLPSREVSIGIKTSDTSKVFYHLSLNEVTVMFAEFESQMRAQ